MRTAPHNGRQSVETRLREAAANRLNHVEFLKLILQDEFSVRGDRWITGRPRAACFGNPSTWENFDGD